MTDAPKSVCVIIPVYQSVNQLAKTVHELIETLISSLEMKTLNYELQRVVLVDDGSSDGSVEIVKSLSQSPLISAIYLNRNYGQHAAIFAAVLSSTEDVIVTMDEDGEHDPLIISSMINELENSKNDIVYASFKQKKVNLKEISSSLAKRFIAFISREPNIRHISSFRAVRGPIFRAASVYANNGSFLDIALGWISNKVSTVVTTKRITDRKSTYNLKGLVNHFSRLFFAAGIKPLIFLFNIGWVISMFSLIGIAVIIYGKIVGSISVQGWVSNIVVIVFFGGLTISSVGLVARYLSSIVETSSGKPFFTIKNQK
jgi:glycosyltransferase involved in cell wall biosynthesis